MKKQKTIELPNAEIEIHYNYFDEKKSWEYFEHLLKNAKWKQETMNMYGKVMNYARLMAWYGESGKNYRFSGKTQKPNDWNKDWGGLLELYVKRLRTQQGQ